MSLEVIIGAYGLMLYGLLRLAVSFYEDMPKRAKYRANKTTRKNSLRRS